MAGKNGNGTDSAGFALPDGLVSFADLKNTRRTAHDEYATLRPFLGKTIVLDFEKMTFKATEKTVRRKGVERVVQGIEGTAHVFVAGEDPSKLAEIVLPLSAIRTLYAYAQQNPHAKIAALVKQGKRGISLG